jgi:hypothetical protein
MATIDFSSMFTQLEQRIGSLAKTTVSGYVSQAEADGKSFVDQIKDDLQQWTPLVAEGKLSRNEFAELLAGDESLLKMEALKEAGLAEIALDNFKNGLFSLIENTVFGII